MRVAYCSVGLILLAVLAAGQTPAGAIAAPADFTVFFRGVAVGTEQVNVSRADGVVTISGTERLAAPLNITLRRAEVRYGADWRPLECVIEGSVREQFLLLHTVVKGTTATTDATQGTKTASQTDQVAADAILLPHVFFGAYEAMAARLATARPGDELKAYTPLQGPATVQVLSVTEDRVRTPSGVLQIRRYSARVTNPNGSSTVEVWVDPAGRLLRFSIPEQAFDFVRTDIASVGSRREPVARPNDEQVTVPSAGFSLAGTLSRPATKSGPSVRLPAIVLVGGSGPTDRDETMADVPIFGHIASALADAGFVVVRYDRRGVGQSGGRAESATLADYAEDVIAAVKYLRNRKDVDPRRVGVIGHGEGGAVAMLAASRGGGIAALVLVAVPGVSGATLVLDQQRHALGLMRIPDAEKQAKIELQEKIQHAVMTGKGLDGIPPDLRRQADTPWFQSFLTYDPAQVMRKVDQPILIVHGELDRQIDPSNADRLEALAKLRKAAAGRTVKLVKVPGTNHLLVPAASGELEEYGRLADRQVSQSVIAAIETWLKETLRAR